LAEESVLACFMEMDARLLGSFAAAALLLISGCGGSSSGVITPPPPPPPSTAQFDLVQVANGFSTPLDNQTGRGEIWPYGLRNPFRFSFDSASGIFGLGTSARPCMRK
jgi:hypothetical protein